MRECVDWMHSGPTVEVHSGLSRGEELLPLRARRVLSDWHLGHILVQLPVLAPGISEQGSQFPLSTTIISALPINFHSFKRPVWLGAVTHTCNPRISGVWGGRIACNLEFETIWGNIGRPHHSIFKKNNKPSIVTLTCSPSYFGG